MELRVRDRAAFAATGGRPFDPALPTVVFVHGAGMDHTVWALQSRYLAHHGRGVLAVNLPGHGRSDGPPLTTIEDMADWLAEVLEAAGVESAAFIGHSMGAIAALSCAARHPDRVRALLLLGSAPAMPVHPDLLAAAKADAHDAIDMVNAWAHGGAAHRGGHPLSGTWLIGGGNRLLERAAPGVLHADLAACNAYADGLADAAKVACPTLVVMGQGDRMTPAKAGAKLVEAIAGARGQVIPGAGHMMMTEQPDATLDAIKAEV